MTMLMVTCALIFSALGVTFTAAIGGAKGGPGSTPIVIWIAAASLSLAAILWVLVDLRWAGA